jgi:phosphatidylserine/phosphatidylglycerophosphate/cardiolipin synthase-like enzyme
MTPLGPRPRFIATVLVTGVFALGWRTSPQAQQNAVAAPLACAGGGECLCDNAYEDCRSPILQLISKETVGIDVSFWFMTDSRYSNALIKRWQAGVPIRIILDTKADASYPANKLVRDSFVNAGLPIRNYRGPGINHWKMMLFAGQGKVEFSAANYADGSYSPSPLTAAYTNYVDEAIYFTSDPAIVNSFMTKFDDQWVDTTTFVNFANINTPLVRRYDTHPVSPDLNFVPDQNFENRLAPQIQTENKKIDAVIFRVTSSKIPDTLIARRNAGVPVRLITEEQQYRNPAYMWDAYNVDRMYMAGILIKIKNNTTDQDVHQKSIVLYSRGLAPLGSRTPMVVFGSSNWTSSSATTQEEHNYFTTESWMVYWFAQQFNRKWNNLKADGTPIGTQVYLPFKPLPPQTPVYASPANDAVGLGTSVTLKWEGGYYAFKYDIYVDTTPTFGAPIVTNYMPSTATAGVKASKESFAVTGLLPGTTYYWKVVSKTMANVSKAGPTWRFSTGGTAPAPATSGTVGAGDIVVYGADGRIVGTAWRKVSDATAAAGQRLWNPNQNATKVLTPSASPASYVEFTINVVAGKPYRLWIRGRAENDSWANDSAFVQFSGAVNASGGAMYRIGTTSAASYNLENCNGCGLAVWGWQDTAYGLNIDPPPIYFATTGPQTLRIQQREDGLSIDQILLSPSTFRTTAPGRLKNDTTIYPRSNGT